MTPKYGTRDATPEEQAAIEHGEGMVAEAAKLALRYMVEHGGNPGYGFAQLEGEGGQAAGIVLVCIDPEKVAPLVEWIAAQGNFSTKIPERKT